MIFEVAVSESFKWSYPCQWVSFVILVRVMGEFFIQVVDFKSIVEMFPNCCYPATRTYASTSGED